MAGRGAERGESRGEHPGVLGGAHGPWLAAGPGEKRVP